VLESVQHVQALETIDEEASEESAPSSLQTNKSSLQTTVQNASMGRGSGEARWVRGEAQVDDIMEALDIVEEASDVDRAIVSHVSELVVRSKARVLTLLPLVRRLVSMGARPELPFFHSLLNRCMSYGGDGLGESLALCDIMYQMDLEFSPQTEAIAIRIRQAHDDDPALAGLEAWDLITPLIRGIEEEEEEEEEDWIQVREITPETRRVFLKHASVTENLDTLPTDYDEWEGRDFPDDLMDLSDTIQP